ncbi:MAG TPA: O-antigen ligase family protein [Candidatus Eisenbacteria bacterium]|nr:O-antigen ligase family protein [Candidatus Eisenbacteria bacterium]
MNGTGMTIQSGQGAIPSPASSRSNLVRTLLISGGIALFAYLYLHMLPDDFMWEGLRVMSVTLVVLASFYFPVGRPKPGLVIWFIMLTTDCLFFHEGDGNAGANAMAGVFPTEVYGESLSWVICFLAVLLCTTRIPKFFSHVFKGNYRWMTLFALLCVISCAYSPKPAFSLVWAFKIVLIALLLQVCWYQIDSMQDILSFLKVTFFGYAIVAFQPVIVSAMRGEMFDEEGRMSIIVNPDALSADAATVFLLALTLFSRVKDEGLRMSAIVFGFSGFVVMVLAGGKAGILSGLIAGALYFLIRKGVGSTLGYVIVAAGVGLLLASFTPLGDYMTQYHSGGNAATLSGRTLLWTAVFPAILANPILGHGYVAATFVYVELNAVGWAAPQLHNGFLETAYNTGGLGFILMMTVIFMIARDLIRVMKRANPAGPIYRITAGCIAIYAVLLINGLFNGTFGGRVRAPFALLMALILVSGKLVKETEPKGSLTDSETPAK